MNIAIKSIAQYNQAFHGAVLSYGAVRFGAVLPHRAAPHDFAFNKTAPNRTVGFSRHKIRTAPHHTSYDSKKTNHIEPRSGRRVFKKILCYGAGTVRCGF